MQMELAENVDEKQSSYMKPGTTNPKYRDSLHSVNDMAKAKSRVYMRIFAYVTCCGLLLLVGGGTFFIYESLVIDKLPEKEVKPDDTLVLGRSAPAPAAYLMDDNANYSKEFQIVAFAFIGVGIVLFVIGAPLATQFYRRYRGAKDSERSPIIDPLSKKDKSKSKIYNPQKQKEPIEQTAESSSTTQTSKKARIFRGKRKTKLGWMHKSRKSFSQEGFRFAAHRHPSMNQITIDSSGFLDRRISENSSGGSDDDIPEVKDSPKMRPKSPGFMGFVSRIFQRNTVKEGDFEHRKLENIPGSSREKSTSGTYEETSNVTTKKHDMDAASDRSNERNTYGVNQSYDPSKDFATDNDGLYNLQD
uniref:uncharacterized protein LOC120347341 isoform X2 n=1 Tax=Styela clava TaxID=7725 RepID=UPI00193AC147|nr:uncharacterized protein LOC120347341 isoform X2 [Styela clava]